MCLVLWAAFSANQAIRAINVFSGILSMITTWLLVIFLFFLFPETWVQITLIVYKRTLLLRYARAAVGLRVHCRGAMIATCWGWSPRDTRTHVQYADMNLLGHDRASASA